MLQAGWKVQWSLKSPLDIRMPVPIQDVTCDCLFQKHDDARNIWRLAQDVIIS